MKVIKNEQLEKNIVKLTIEIDAQTFKDGIKKAYNKNVKHINIPGFRKGKAPMGIIEQYYGEGIFYEDAVNFVCPDAYEAAVKETGIDPVDRPEIDIEKIGKDEALVITATVTVKPEVILGDYKGIEVEKTIYETTAEDIENQLKQEQEKNSRMVNIEDRAVKMGDFTIIDFEGFTDGVSFEGGKGQDYPLEIGAGQFIPGFEEALVGAEIGKEVDVNVTFPEEYHAEELKGKPAVFKVTVKEIKEKDLPELNDDFAKDVSEFDTLDEYKASIKAKLDEANEKRTKSEFENRAIDTVSENATVEIPQCMIDSQLETIARDFDYRLQAQGLNLEKYMELMGSNIDAFKEQFKDQAESQVKTSLVLEAVAKAENIDVTDDEVETEIEKMAQMYNMEVDKVKSFMREEEMESLKGDIKVRKAVELITAEAKEVKAKAAKKTTTKSVADKSTTKKTTTAKSTTTKKSTTAKKTTKAAEEN